MDKWLLYDFFVYLRLHKDNLEMLFFSVLYIYEIKVIFKILYEDSDF